MPPTSPKPPLNPFLGQLGANLREGRKAANLTLAEMEERTNLPWSMIGAIERGHQNTSMVTIARLAVAAGLTWAEVTKDLPNPPPKPPEKKRRRGPR